MKGIIALDIDGTITAAHNTMEEEVVQYLNHLYTEGWTFIFITGRSFQWGFEVLQALPFPYFFAVQNGAILLQMPERTVLLRKYLHGQILDELEEICRDEPSGFVIYTGYENEDICYYFPTQFASHLLAYVEKRARTLKEKWIALDSYDTFKKSEFPSVKLFGSEDSAVRMAEKIENRLRLHVPLVKDPFDARFYVAQATEPSVHKGGVLKSFANLIGWAGIRIAAGDDNNDRSMLEAADVKIAMATAPLDMRQNADIIAPSANELGIITGLKEAISQIKSSRNYPRESTKF